jgi:ubiquinone/menaquinone biosynthesis C-methylase UbiE
MKVAFDDLAKEYDAGFSESAIGRLQRNRVWHFLENRILPSQKSKILEVNCGTGVDAIWLANQGHEVLATDISGEMIQRAASKVHPKNLKFLHAGFGEIKGLAAPESTDLIFSDFGGLNCISPDELRSFLDNAFEILKPNGSLALVIMPRFCFWETIYYSFKKPSLAFRRLKKKAEAFGFLLPMDVYYYNPTDLTRLANGTFKKTFQAPIGFFIPPSYLEHFFSKRPEWLHFFYTMEKLFGWLPMLSRFSDHYIIQLTKLK